ncbi:MAG: branched-chain amino acid aminotransferase [Candidatus Promineifilaceae bacterium]
MKPPMDWDTLSVQFTQTDYMFIAETDAHNTWKKGEICSFKNLQISPASAVFNYGQAAFEGLKALHSVKGNVVLCRPIENARRFHRAAARLEMPPYPLDEFIQAVKDTVRANAPWIPPHEKGSLYIRPVMIGNGPVLGVGPAPSYIFFIFVCPVRQYMPGEGKLVVLDSVHRTAHFSTGDIKASGNYAGTLRPHRIAASKGYKDVLYLDSRLDKFVEELGSSNFFAVLRDGTLVTPQLGAILPGVTRDSVITIANELFGWNVAERELHIEEVLVHAQEAFFTGTAAVIQPVTTIGYKGRDYKIGTGEVGESTKELSRTLKEIQTQQRADPFSWVEEIGADLAVSV